MAETAAESAVEPSNWAVVGALAAVTALSGAASLHGLGHVARAAAVLIDHDVPVTPGRLMSALNAVDYALWAATLAAVALLAAWEWRSRAVSLFLMTASPKQAFVVLTLVVGWSGQAYLFPGLLLGGDTGSHIARFLEMRRGFDEGVLAQWTNYDYLGSSLLGFTGPLTYLVGGALDVLVRDPVATAKILLFTTHLIAGWTFFALLRRLGSTVAAALVASIGFAGSFALLHLFLYRGVFPQQFTIVFLVLAFYAAEGLMRGLPGRGRDWLLFALTTTGLVINHQPHALFVAFYLGVFGAANWALGRWQIAKLPLLVSAGVIGLLIATFAVAPILVEGDWVMIDSESGFLRLQLPTLERLWHLVRWHNTRGTWGIDYWTYVGDVSVILAVLGGWAALSRHLGEERRRLALALLPGAVVSFFVYNPVVRDIIFIVFFVALFAALGTEYVVAHARRSGRMLAVVFLAAVLDMASTSPQPVARTDKEPLIDAGRWLERNAANQRIVEVELQRDGSFAVDMGPGAAPVSYYSTVERIAGVHNMAATRVHNYAETIVKLADAELHRDGRLSAETEHLLALLDASRIVCFGPAAVGCPAGFADTQPEPPLGNVVHVVDATPVIFSRALTALAPPPGLDKPMVWDYQFDGSDPQVAAITAFLHRYLQETGLQLHDRSARALAVRRLPAAAASAAPSEASPWHVSVTRYAVGLQRVAMTITADGPGYAQLAHPWYPASEVRINGRVVEPMEGALDLMVVPLDAGVNAIEIRPVMTPVRVWSWAASGIALLIALVTAGALGRRRSPSAPAPGKSR